ncbi:MAG: carboxypeptidase-like regulatory domain-containing protein [Elusimicrobiota bacterium]
MLDGGEAPPAEPPKAEPKPEPKHEEKPRFESSLPKTQIISAPPPADAVKREEKTKLDSSLPKTMIISAVRPPEAVKEKEPEKTPAVEPPPEPKAPEAKKEEPHAEAAKKPEHAPVLLTRCPGCAKQISETVEICPYCKRDFRTPEEKSSQPAKPASQAPAKPKRDDGLDLPRHMLAELDAEPRTMDNAENVLPPHMLQSQFELKRPPEPKGVSSWMFVAVGAVLMVALFAPKFLKKEQPAPEQPPPVVVVTPVQQPAPQPEPVAEPEPPVEPEAKPPEPPPVEKPEAKPPPKKKKGKKTASPEEPVVIAENTEPPRAPRASNWVLRGRLIDLVTFKPVEGVELALMDAGSNEAFKSTVSGSDGSFRFKKVPPNSQGYLLTVRHADYLPKYVLDKNQAYKSMSEDQRKEEARRFVRMTPSNPTLFSRGEAEIEQDFIMIPREKHGKTLEEALQD